MKRIYIVVLATVLFSTSSFAQKGNNLIGVGADLSFPTSDFGTFFKTGIGVYVKGMLGIGQSGQLTFTSGYSGFNLKGSNPDFKTTVTVVPLLFGYRHNFKSNFFAEPQIGYGILGYKEKDEEGYWTDSNGAFTWAATVGYMFNKQVEVSARYQSGGKEGTIISLFGLRVGYNFSLGGSK